MIADLLGTQVTAFSAQQFLDRIRSGWSRQDDINQGGGLPMVGPKPSNYMNKSELFYDSNFIYGLFAPNGVALCMLRNEQIRLKLDQMILDRQNKYLTKYFNSDQIVDEYKNQYGYVTGSQYYQKLSGFNQLSGALTDRNNRLAAAYTAHPPGDASGVAMAVQSTTTPSGTVVTTNQSEPLGGLNQNTFCGRPSGRTEFHHLQLQQTGGWGQRVAPDRHQRQRRRHLERADPI